MTIRQLRERIAETTADDDEERERILLPFFEMCTSVTHKSLLVLQQQWMGKREKTPTTEGFEEFVEVQTALILALIDFETSPRIKPLRDMEGLDPITLDTEIVTKGK